MGVARSELWAPDCAKFMLTIAHNGNLLYIEYIQIKYTKNRNVNVTKRARLVKKKEKEVKDLVRSSCKK